MELNMNAQGGIAQADSATVTVVEKRERVLPEQKVYADLLDQGMKAGLVMLVISFSLYVLGIVEPHVPLAEVAGYWSLPVARYLEVTGVGVGWSWLGLATKGDYMNLIGIAFLSAVTIGCYIRILPIAWKAGEKVYSGIVAITALVLILGASGILAAGH